MSDRPTYPLLLYKQPKGQNRRSDEECQYILSDQAAQNNGDNATHISAWQILHNRLFWDISLSRLLAESDRGIF